MNILALVFRCDCDFRGRMSFEGGWKLEGSDLQPRDLSGSGDGYWIEWDGIRLVLDEEVRVNKTS